MLKRTGEEADMLPLFFFYIYRFQGQVGQPYGKVIPLALSLNIRSVMIV